MEGTSAANIPTISATGTVRPSMAPSRSASLTSPMPMPFGYASAARKRKNAAPKAAERPFRARLEHGLATRTIAAAGSTITLGTIRCERSIAEIATSVAQKNAATNDFPDQPNARKEAATSRAVSSSTAG